MTDQSDPVPRPLFEAALRVLKGEREWGDIRAMWREQPIEKGGWDYRVIAERIVRRAAACGVGEEG